MRRILFSPIGGTDPITNFHDGAMLHICRVYHPDFVYLYLSKEMCDYQKLDKRYTQVIEWLNDRDRINIGVKVIEDNKMTEVQLFDAFIELFEIEIKKIFAENGEEVELLVNVSSGTPAMKSSLQLLSFMYPKLRAIQVSTPAKGLNKIHENREKYELEEQWECDDDNEENFFNRCIESKAALLQDRIIKETVCKFIDEYDYRAAQIIANNMHQKPNNEFESLLSVAYDRSVLNLRNVKKTFPQLPKEIFPIQSGDEIAIFEYTLSLILKCKKGEYADFLRGITPLSTELMKRIMEKECKVTVESFAKCKSNGSYVVVKEKVKNNPEIYDAFKLEFLNDTIRETDVSSIHYKSIICKMSKNIELKNDVTDIRTVESNVRNLAAHQIISVTSDFVYSKTGYKIEEIISIIKRLVVYSGINVKKEYWEIYDLMNEKLKSML